MTMNEYARESGLAALEFARRVTLGLLEEFPEDKVLYQPFPGANHAVWIVGHIALTDDWFLTHLMPRTSKVPESWTKLFGQGSAPQTDPSAYPTVAELNDKLTDLRAELMDWFRSMSDEQLTTPLPEDWETFAPSYGGMMPSIAWHEGLHDGQLTVVRKSLGLAPKFG
jgi:uncharacterized damage-inducible protein DinB